MIVVKRKGDLVRFGLFLALMGTMAYFIAAKMETWRSARASNPGSTPANGSLLGGTQGVDIIRAANGSPEGVDFFAEFRLNREKNRGALKETLKEVMETESADAETRREATQQYLGVSKLASLEDQAETMVQAKGFEEAVVHLGQSNAQVVIRAKNLSADQYMQVVDMVSRITGTKVSAVQVFNRER